MGEVLVIETLPKKQRKQPGWFKENEDTLLPLIEARNEAVAQNFGRKSRSKTKRVRECRKKLKQAIKTVRNNWIMRECEQLNENVSQQRGTKPAWDAINKLKAGLSKTKPSSVKNMTKSDGSACKSPKENAEVFRSHFQELFSREPTFDETVLELLDQLPVAEGLDGVPTDEEIEDAIDQLRNTAPGESGLCAQAYKCMAKQSETYNLLKEMVLDFWQSGKTPSEWEKGLLKILPKKGDLGLPGNHRGIMLLEIAYKIVANLLRKRLLPIEEALDHESQCGFRPGRGCTDAVFTIKMALKKRQEHGLESWVLFLDLVKAFDRVPRELLWLVLAKFGVPEKIVSLLRSLHETVTVKFQVQGISHTVNSTIGVKQGDVLGPILFTFFAAAIMITWRKVSPVPVCIFRTKEDFILTGRSHRAYGEDFAVSDSVYADDTAGLFDSRASIDVGVPQMITHFARFGMEIHTGSVEEEKESKTVILFCSKPAHLYEDPETFDNVNLGNLELPNGRHIPIVDEFVYLGSTVARDCSDGEDVKSRIDKAGDAFGALRKSLLSSGHVSYAAKKFVYTRLVLTILLYGSESWCLTEELLRELRTFHRRCVRAMCRVNRLHTRTHRITTQSLLDRLKLSSIDDYITTRQLRWAGHVARMPFNRLPRKMLSCWVRHKRPRGAPRFTYGRSLKKALKKANIQLDNWHEAAANRAEWRKSIHESKE